MWRGGNSLMLLLVKMILDLIRLPSIPTVQGGAGAEQIQSPACSWPWIYCYQ